MSLSFHPVISTFAIVLLAITWTFLCAWGFQRAKVVRGNQNQQRRVWIPWLRRTLIGCFLVLAFAGPSIPAAEEEIATNVEILLAVDRTGSMAAEDGPEGQQRLEQVAQTINELVDATAGSRYSIVTWDSSARLELPVTTDSSAVTSFSELLHQEISEFSAGSSINRPVETLLEALQNSQENRPENVRYLFVFSDGESTDSSDTSVSALWQEIGGLIDGGAVLGFGTPTGGNMQVYRSGEGQTGEYMTDPNDGSALAVSKLDQEILSQVAEDLGVPLEINPSSEQISQRGSDLMEGSQQIDDGREMRSTSQYLIWPLGILISGLLVWELASYCASVVWLWRNHGI